MRAKNSLKIAVGNYSLVFKNLLYKITLFVIFALLLGLILRLALQPFIDQLRPVFASVYELIKAIVSGDAHETAITALKDSVSAFFKHLSNNIGGIVWMIIIIVVFAFVYRFLTGVSDCTLMILVNDHMAELAPRSYIGVMIENLKKILVYQLIDTVSALIWTALTCLLTWGVFTLLALVTPLLSLFGALLIIILSSSLYNTVFSQVMANVLLGNHKTVKQALKEGFSFKKEYFWQMFVAYLTVIIILVYLHVSVTLFTFGVGELLLIPFASLLVVCMKTVDYYTICKKKYFIDYDTIIIPKELRENDENLLSNVDI
ncbi:MAG: hypothetical protein IJY84_06800 [Clostridia bacterium]|nr:hypothetical protein [Clostridia bacterium]